MARAPAEKQLSNFVKGIITEAGPLGYPENSVRNLVNIDLLRNGGGKVRNGLIDASDESIDSLQAGEAISVGEFPNPAGTNEHYVVVQVGDTLHVHSTDTDQIGERSYRVSYLDELGNVRYDYPGAFTRSRIGVSEAQIKNTPLRYAAANSVLFCTNIYTGPFYIMYMPNGRQEYQDTLFEGQTDLSNEPTFHIVLVQPKIRDFIGVEDGLGIDERPTELTAEHEYNLRNQGWSKGRINKFFRGATPQDFEIG